MSGKTTIEWTDRVWNPAAGCTRVSDGCRFCYAFQLHDQRHLAWKRGRWPAAAAQYHHPFSRVQLLPERLSDPLRWRNPRRIFVNSMSDLFHEDVPDAFLDRVFAVMAATPRHTYQVLSKRPERMAAYVSSPVRADAVAEAADQLSDEWMAAGEHRVAGAVMEAEHRLIEGYDPWPLPNVWLGTSVEDQRAADERIPHLLRAPAAVRFLSCEPLLGPVDGAAWLQGGRDPSRLWCIVGGESGPHARPMDPEWARSLRDQCQAAGVAFHFKQHGGRTPKSGGRLLDGREWNEFPVEVTR